MTYAEGRELMIEYLKLKTELEDWHGVADAANDLREMDAEERGKQEMFHASQRFGEP